MMLIKFIVSVICYAIGITLIEHGHPDLSTGMDMFFDVSGLLIIIFGAFVQNHETE